ncbi:MAG: hypothetical protein M1838_004811 [Thelocarpon superellum]|nr:MAG: hypothetical protein M1838_004811 [Thelocarpon superellum]
MAPHPQAALSRYLGGVGSGMTPFAGGHPSQQQQQHLQQQQQQHHLGSSTLANPLGGGAGGGGMGGHPSAFGNPSNLSLFAASAGAGNLGRFGGGFGGAGGAAGGGLGGGVGGLGGGPPGGVGGGTGLGSHAAQMGFAHGAALQRQEANEGAGLGAAADPSKGLGKGRIRDVWRNNLAQEMAVLRGLVDKYPYIAMDTEFPGIVARPMGTFTTKADYHYQTLRCNVDLLKMIQLGITLFTVDGDAPPAQQSTEASNSNGTGYPNNLIPCPCTWQFNFRFSIHSDMYAQDSIDLLQKSGLDFQMHEKNGIDPLEFGSYLITSGMVLLEDVRWISFHSGYDFGYLLKIMLCRPLPDDEVEYRKLLHIFFPSLYDIKYLMKAASRHHVVNHDSPLSPQAQQIINSLGQKSSLQDIADELGVKRIGPTHQAGSDSLVTGKVFFEVRRLIFGGSIEEDMYLGQIWGLNGVGLPAAQAAANALASNALSNSAGASNFINGADRATYQNGGGAPSTPNNTHAGLASTPGHGHGAASNGMSLAMGNGGGAGAFGAFQFGK